MSLKGKHTRMLACTHACSLARTHARTHMQTYITHNSIHPDCLDNELTDRKAQQQQSMSNKLGNKCSERKPRKGNSFQVLFQSPAGHVFDVEPTFWNIINQVKIIKSTQNVPFNNKICLISIIAIYISSKICHYSCSAWSTANQG